MSDVLVFRSILGRREIREIIQRGENIFGVGIVTDGCKLKSWFQPHYKTIDSPKDV